jgi:hypothetical protein
MRACRSLTLLAIPLVLAACQDATAPVGREASGPPQYSVSSSTISVLRQAPTAPPLETYRLSFWAYVGKPATVTVNYKPAPGQWVGAPFLRFAIPANGLVTGAGGTPLNYGDSVLVTLSVDSLAFAVHLDPSGVQFSPFFPATLTLWYANANPDVNGDGTVTGYDKYLLRQLTLWYYGQTWTQLPSQNDPALQYVATNLYHFSDYALSW